MATRIPITIRRLPGPSLHAAETVIVFAAPGIGAATAMDAAWRERWRALCGALGVVVGEAAEADAAAAEATGAFAAAALGVPPPAIRRAPLPGEFLLPEMDRDLAVSAARLAVASVDLTRTGSPPAAAIARMRQSAEGLRGLAGSLPSVAARPLAGPLVEGLSRLGLPWGWSRVHPGLVRVGEGRHLTLFDGLKSMRERHLGGVVARNKLAIKRYLSSFGLPVLPERVVTDINDVAAAAESIGYPIAVKPIDGSLGHGLSLDVRTPAEAAAAFETARRHGTAVMFEPFLAVPDFRAVVVDGAACFVFQRVPPAIVGDGRSTIGALIAAHDRAVAAQDPAVPARHPIGHDAEVDRTLARDGRTVGSVPETGQRVTVRTAPLLHIGGHPVDWTDRLHPSIHALFRRLAELVDLAVFAIDFRAEAVDRSWTAQRFAILEYNSRPNLGDFVGHPVVDRIIRRVAPDPEAVRLPTILVVDPNPGDGPARLRRQIDQDLLPFGLRSAEGLHLGGLAVAVHPGEAHLRMTEDPTLAVAIHWASPHDLARHGIGALVIDLAWMPADASATPSDLRTLVGRLARHVERWDDRAMAPTAILAAAGKLAR